MNETTTGPARQLLFGVPFDPLTVDEAVGLAERAVRDRRRLLVGVVNAAKVSKLKTDRLLRESLLSSDVILADGQSVVWASRLLRRPLPERVAGITLFESLLAAADHHGHRVFLLGARPEVLKRVEETVRRRWPGVVLAGSRDGYFDDSEAEEVAAQIAASHADLLFLGITTPKKENFLARFADDLDVPVMHGVGGSFDILAGVTRRAPLIWQRLGCEWAYRVLQEPRRLWRRYLVTNLAFLGLLAIELVHRHPGYPSPNPDVARLRAEPDPARPKPAGSPQHTYHHSQGASA